MRKVRTAVLGFTLVLAGAATASADATVFIGANTTPETRRVQGVAVGAGLLLFAFEIEYANSPEASGALGPTAPSLTTGMGNVLLQAPFAIFGFQPYATVGGGFYRERLGRRQQTGFAPNTGFGVKISLIGPLRLRVDYRAFSLGDDALYSPAHRLYAGLNLKF